MLMLDMNGGYNMPVLLFFFHDAFLSMRIAWGGLMGVACTHTFVTGGGANS